GLFMRILINHFGFVFNCIAAVYLLLVSLVPVLGQGEEEVADQIIALGGGIVRDAKGRIRDVDLFLLPDASVERIDFKSLTGLKSVNIGGRRTSDRTLVRLQTIAPCLEDLRISAAQITDDALIDLLRKQQSLRSLTLNRMAVTDKSMAEVGKLKELWYLGLSRTKITDKGLAQLVGLSKLESIYLPNTEISDAGMKEIKNLKSLRSVILDGTKVTDDGIQELCELKNLGLLGVNSTKVTEAGKAAMKAALPQLRFSKGIDY